MLFKDMGDSGRTGQKVLERNQMFSFNHVKLEMPIGHLNRESEVPGE